MLNAVGPGLDHSRGFYSDSDPPWRQARKLAQTFPVTVVIPVVVNASCGVFPWRDLHHLPPPDESYCRRSRHAVPVSSVQFRGTHRGEWPHSHYE